MENSQEYAKIWWNNLSDNNFSGKETKSSVVYKHLGNMSYQRFSSLTEEEIHDMFLKETANIDPSDLEAAYRMQVGTTTEDTLNNKRDTQVKAGRLYTQEEVDRLLDQQACRTAAQILKDKSRIYIDIFENYSDETKIKILTQIYFMVPSNLRRRWYAEKAFHE